jgi:hypothetical protein
MLFLFGTSSDSLCVPSGALRYDVKAGDAFEWELESVSAANGSYQRSISFSLFVRWLSGCNNISGGIMCWDMTDPKGVFADQRFSIELTFVPNTTLAGGRIWFPYGWLSAPSGRATIWTTLTSCSPDLAFFVPVDPDMRDHYPDTIYSENGVLLSAVRTFSVPVWHFVYLDVDGPPQISTSRETFLARFRLVAGDAPNSRSFYSQMFLIAALVGGLAGIVVLRDIRGRLRKLRNLRSSQ